jgi:hypothetical protein
MKNIPPSGLFTPGEHEDGSSTVALTVYACTDSKGFVWSAHAFQTDEDAQRASQWPGGGTRHLAHALLTEAVRRESFVCALVALSQDEATLEAYQNGTAETQQHLVEVLAKKVELNLKDVVHKLTEGAAQEVLLMLCQQLGQQKTPTEKPE